MFAYWRFKSKVGKEYKPNSYRTILCHIFSCDKFIILLFDKYDSSKLQKYVAVLSKTKH